MQKNLPDPFESRVSAALGQSLTGKKFLAAVSGGADSTAMLAALAVLQKEAGYGLHCIHVEHGLRPAEESCGDALAVKALCEKLKVPCTIVSIPRGKIALFASRNRLGIQAAARFFRHRAFKREAKRVKADKILVGHTRDDLLETILMRLLRGAGPAGLAPMPRERGRITRPILDFSRQEVLEYLEKKGIPYRTDASNADTRYLRSRTRLRLVPLLNEFFPGWQTSLLSLAETQNRIAEFLSEEACKRLPWQEKAGGLWLAEDVFRSSPSILREEAVFSAVNLLADGNSVRKNRKLDKAPRRSTVRKAVDQGNSMSAYDLGPVRLTKHNGFINIIAAEKSPAERSFSFLVKKTGSYVFNRIKLQVEQHSCPETSTFPAALPLVFRSHEKGDCLFKGGHKRRLSDILILDPKSQGLVLDPDARSGYTDIITVCDAKGTAAFIAFNSRGQIKVISRDNEVTGDTVNVGVMNV